MGTQVADLDLLRDGPLFGEDVAGLDAPEADSPDNWLFGVAAQGHVSELKGAQPTSRNEPNTVEAPPGAATSGGSVAAALDNAHGWIGTMYDWGGNGYAGRGVDCSGLVYNAFKRAGFNIERYRAVDYGHMGVAVDTADARAGDIVYFDNPGDVDHVGIYLGDGKFIESPQSGERVKVSNLRGGAQIRRIFPSDAQAELHPSSEGKTQYFAPDGERFLSGPAAGPQRDPLEVIDSLEADADAIVQQDLEIGTPQDVELSGETQVPSAGAGAVDKSTPGGQFNRLMNAMAGQESGGDYHVVNSIGAIGKYQVMTANVGSWSRQVLGHSISPAEFRNSPDLQEQIVRGIFGGYVRQYGTRGALAKWYSGNADREDDYSHVKGGPSVGAYVDQVIARMR